jgi:hypothetical protein
MFSNFVNLGKSMWLGHDLSWWSLIIALAALALTIPLTILGNIITPALLNWWSGRSVASLALRIAKLGDQLKGYEALPPLDEPMALLLKAASNLIDLALFILILVTLVYWQVGTFALHQSHDFGRFTELVWSLGIFGPGAFAFLLLTKRYKERLDKYRIPRSPHVRDNLRKSIDKLKAKLSSAIV